jgi:hypothetical protein
MYTSSILSSGTKIDTPELLSMIDHDTDIDILLSTLCEIYIHPDRGDKNDNSVFASINLKETMKYVLLAISHKFPEKLENSIKQLPIRILKNLSNEARETSSEHLQNIYNMIADEYTRKFEESIKNILPPTVKVASLDANTREFDQGNIHFSVYDGEFPDNIFSVEKLIGISTEPINQMYMSRYLSGVNKFINHIEVCHNHLQIPRETLIKYVDLKKYPKLRFKRSIDLDVVLIVAKRKNKFYWQLYIYDPKRTNHSTEVSQEKQKLGKELAKKFKFQNKEVDCLIVGTEEKIIEELKQRFPKEVK